MTINVLFLHSGDSWIRGSEKALLTALGGLDRSKVTPYVLCNHQILADEVAKLGIETIVYPIPQIMIDDGNVSLQFLQWVATLRKVLQLSRRWEIDLLYANGGRPCQVLYTAAKFARLPLICHIHVGYDARYILLYQLDRAGKVIFVSRENELSMCGRRRFRGHHEVVYNGVDTDRFAPPTTKIPKFRERWSIPFSSFVIGQVGSLIHRKGTDLLIRAFQIVHSRHPEARLVLVSDGPYRQQLEILARELEVEESVTFTGYVDDTLPFFQHVFDVHVLASREEGMGISLAEGAACGLPSVGANAGGIPEVVIDGRNGLLFDRENHQMLAERICQLIDDRRLCKQLGVAGRELALERFSVQAFNDSILRIILETASSQQRKREGLSIERTGAARVSSNFPEI